MKSHFFKQTSGSNKVLAHAIKSNLWQILFQNFHGKVMRKAKNWTHFSQIRPICRITAKFQNGVIFFFKFQKLAFNYVGKRSIDSKLFFESFEIFGTTLLINVDTITNILFKVHLNK